MHSPTLRLIDCDFKYFFHMQALVQVETNNLVEMGIVYNADGTESVNADGTVTDRFLARVGGDRGARVEIINSSFKHSRFCKGMIVYHEFEHIGYSDYPNYVDTAPMYQGLIQTHADSRREAHIKISGSLFENLGYHQVVTALSNLNAPSVLNQDIKDFCAHTWRPFNHRGLVMNLQGFPGSVDIDGSVFTKNMVYIRDILIREYSDTTRFIDVDQMDASIFER